MKELMRTQSVHIDDDDSTHNIAEVLTFSAMNHDLQCITRISGDVGMSQNVKYVDCKELMKVALFNFLLLWG